MKQQKTIDRILIIAHTKFNPLEKEYFVDAYRKVVKVAVIIIGYKKSAAVLL